MTGRIAPAAIFRCGAVDLACTAAGQHRKRAVRGKEGERKRERALKHFIIEFSYSTTVATTMALVKVAQTGEVRENAGKELNINGTRIALFHANGRYYAIEALCRHQDGSLAPGRVEGEVVECPLHSWHYNIKTGELLDYLEGVKLTTYKVDVKGNDIYIEV